MSRAARGAALLEPALHFPARADEANESLGRLRFRRAVRGSDLVALARLAEQGKVPAAVMGRAASRLQKLLTRSVVTQLKSIRFLDTGQGRLTAPADAYIRSDRLIAALGDDAPYATGMPAAVLRRLGCRTEPGADDILANLAELRESGLAVSRPDIVYRVLVAALRRERRRIWRAAGPTRSSGRVTGGRHQVTAWSARTTVTPSSTRSPCSRMPCATTGCSSAPIGGRPRRTGFACSSGLASDTAPGTEYRRRSRAPCAGRTATSAACPKTLEPTTCCLLDDRGRLHAPSEAAAGTFLINDEPALASAARAAGVPLAFADTAGGQLTGFLTASRGPDAVWRSSPGRHRVRA